MERRQFLTLTGATTLPALAGCTSGDTEDGSSGGDEGGSGGSEGEKTTSTSTPTATPMSTATSGAKQDVEILEDSLKTDTLDLARVIGKVKNTSGKDQSLIKMSVKFFNKSDERVGEGQDMATDVSAGTVVNFEVISAVKAKKVDRYTIEASTVST